MPDLFEAQARQYYAKNAPLAERMRPRSLDEVEGQNDLLGAGQFLRQMIEGDKLRSLIFWGPPGTGKTTLARLLAGTTGSLFRAISAVSSGVKDIKDIIKDAEDTLKFERRGTVLFIDEIHRFNKAQQDALLFPVEQGTLTLIGATTENPSFEVNSALLSRCQVVVLKTLSCDALQSIAQRALSDSERGLGALALQMTEEAEAFLTTLAQGDARTLLNLLELGALKAKMDECKEITRAHIEQAAGKRAILYDKNGEEHYNIISAFIKSLRGSDPDAALYYLARMMEGGEDPLFIARRMIIFASEDVGNAEPQALQLAVACKEAVHFIGLPEALYPLSQTAVYLATAPKSNASGAGFFNAKAAVKEHGPLAVPLHIRNAPTTLMKELGYGQNYHYPHDYADNFVVDEYLPDVLRGSRFFEPGDKGFEKEIAKRLEYWHKLKQQGLSQKIKRPNP